MFSFNGKSFKDEGYKAYVSPPVEEEEQAYNTIVSHWEEFLSLNDPNLEKDRDYFINKKIFMKLFGVVINEPYIILFTTI